MKLVDCCNFLSGGTPEKGKAAYWKGEIPWFSPKDIKSFDLVCAQDFISETAIRESATRLIEPGTILVVGRSGVLAHTLPVGIVRQMSAFNQDIKAIVPGADYDPEFIALFLRAHQALVLKDGVKRGPTVHSLIANFLEELEIPNLLLQEQRQIAARLKGQLAEAETARQAGQVQVRDAELLRQRLLRQTFAALHDVPCKVLGEWARTTSGTTPPRGDKRYWSPAEIPWVKTGEVAFAPIARTEEAISRQALAECSLTLLPPRTVLIAMYGQGKTRGQSAILEIEAATNQACFAVLPNEAWDAGFLHYWLMASYDDLRGLSDGRGGNQANLNGGLLSALEVPAPDVGEQRRIVTRLKSQLAETDAIAEAAAAQLAEIERLPQRLLAQAFNTEGTTA
ncbi:MAG: restriction endonuclease subunit S [Candidatus Accumulibacter sp.]|uniref:restriction endonuclease subunit S n=1 Tax=Accumulibacter sp. TaxID=2053492 RepID=UPI00258426A5|nr:restriction endonuclease subunit S [Accumulibacter sp.]MCM8622434.1 restriction endonuclease subunit S [Accumulibacter sp.]